MIHAVIMAGGAGTRFWPISRTELPKQLLPLVGRETMIQETARRLEGLVPSERILVVTNQRLVEAVARQLPDLPAGAIVGEPCKRDTAPCVGLAAALVGRDDPDATMIVMPADHVIRPDDAFRESLRTAVRLVEQSPTRIVTFGIRPDYAAEIYGYIQRGSPPVVVEGDEEAPPVFPVTRFREKPAREVAREYLESGDYYWNSGIFVWKARTILEALRRFEPTMHAHVARIAEAVGSDRFEEVLAAEFEAIEGKSIDYAVMEHYRDVLVIEAPFRWDDVGNWNALQRLRGSDADGNTIVGRHLGIGTSGSIVRGDDDHLIVTVGVEDLIVVHTPDATLVARKQDEERLRDVVRQLRERDGDRYL